MLFSQSLCYFDVHTTLSERYRQQNHSMSLCCFHNPYYVILTSIQRYLNVTNKQNHSISECYLHNLYVILTSIQRYLNVTDNRTTQ